MATACAASAGLSTAPVSIRPFGCACTLHTGCRAPGGRSSPAPGARRMPTAARSRRTAARTWPAVSSAATVVWPAPTPNTNRLVALAGRTSATFGSATKTLAAGAAQRRARLPVPASSDQRARARGAVATAGGGGGRARHSLPPASEQHAGETEAAIAIAAKAAHQNLNSLRRRRPGRCASTFRCGVCLLLAERRRDVDRPGRVRRRRSAWRRRGGAVGGAHDERQTAKPRRRPRRAPPAPGVTSSVTVRAWLSPGAVGAAPCMICWSMAMHAHVGQHGFGRDAVAERQRRVARIVCVRIRSTCRPARSGRPCR